ncbi:MAG: polysaccharide biosynthesis protein PslG [Mycobacterium sp.]|nr:polysaccharide biosynthesis protein PslG [Mycobacterium sp.]
MVKIVFAGMATVAISAMGATAMVPTTSTMTANVLPVAAIDESSDTIGFADSDLYGMTPAQIDAQLDQMQALGVNNVRIMIPWAGVEPIENTYDWSTVDYMVNAADSRGMGVLGVLNSSPSWAVAPGDQPISGAPASPDAYGDFAGLVAQRYAGKVGAYEIWNEPNAFMFYSPKPDPAAYTELLKAAYPAIKAADPNATVIGGVTGAVVDYGDQIMNPVTFVNGIYAAGGEGYFDALSFHPYLYSLPFSQGAPYPQSPLTQLQNMRAVMVANGDSDKLIWASEYGEPTSAVSEPEQAAYLQDMLTTWRTLGYTGPAFVWTLQDRATGSTDPEDTFGVIRSDGTLKPAAYVIQQLASQASTTPAVARMALAMPDAQEAAPADLAVLTALAQTPTAAATPEPATPMSAAMQMAATTLNAGTAVAASSLAAAGQVVAASLQEANAMVMATVPKATAVPDTSPAAVPSTTGPVSTQQARQAQPVTASVPESTGPQREATASTDAPEQGANAAAATPAAPAATAATPAAPAAATPAAPAPAAAAATPAAPAVKTPKSSVDAPKKRPADAPKQAAGKNQRSADDQSQGRHRKQG